LIGQLFGQFQTGFLVRFVDPPWWGKKKKGNVFFRQGVAFTAPVPKKKGPISERTVVYRVFTVFLLAPTVALSIESKGSRLRLLCRVSKSGDVEGAGL